MGHRAALVAGGSSGIGKAMARVLGQEGYAEIEFLPPRQPAFVEKILTWQGIAGTSR